MRWNNTCQGQQTMRGAIVMKSKNSFNQDHARTNLEDQLTVGDRILLWLLQHPYQRLEDVAQAMRMHSSSAHRYLAQFTEQRLVESVTPTPGLTSTRFFYFLTSRGIGAVARLLNAPPEQVASRWHANESNLLRLLPRLYTLAWLQDLINSLASPAPHALAFPGEDFALIRWHWMRDYQHLFVSKGRSMICHIDAALVLARSSPSIRDKPEDYYTAFVLIDP